MALSDHTALESISLVQSLRGEWLKLPLAAMRDVGPAAQTLGGLLRLSNKETFRAVSEIARTSRLPVTTVRKHLVKLADAGWIKNAGRGRTASDWPQRTCTIVLTDHCLSQLEPWGWLPLWACSRTEPHGVLSWASKSVFSVVMARLVTLAAVQANAIGDGDGRDEDIVAGIEHLGGDDRFQFGLRYIQERTGLARASVLQAKHQLSDIGILSWRSGGGRHAPDLLIPNYDFPVIAAPTDCRPTSADASRN